MAHSNVVGDRRLIVCRANDLRNAPGALRQDWVIPNYVPYS